MIPGQHIDRYARLADAENPAGELALVRRVGLPASISVAGENHQIDLLTCRCIGNLIQRATKIDKSGIQPCGGIWTTVQFDAHVGIGEVKNFQMNSQSQS